MRMLAAAAAAAAMMFSESDYRIISGEGVGERGGPSRQIIADPSEQALALSVGRHGARIDSGGVGKFPIHNILSTLPRRALRPFQSYHHSGRDGIGGRTS